MQVTSLLLLVATTAIAAAQSPECFNGQLREEFFLEYCYYGEWRRICSQDSQWNIKKAMAACTRLGYSDSGITRIDEQCPLPRIAVTLTDCNGPGLTNCTVTKRSCEIHCSVVLLQQCNTANCPDGALRLVGGSTDREGRVEVCVNGTQWRTVCTGSQELAGAVCSQLGYTFEGSSVAEPNSFPPGAFPEYRLECTGGECTAVKAHCTNSFMELGVICKTPSTNIGETTQLPSTLCTDHETESYSTCTDNFTTFIAGIAVLVVLQAATIIALISTCVVFKRKLKQRTTMTTQQADVTYAVVGSSHPGMKVDPNIAANPAYESVKCDQEDHTYDVVSEGVASRQRRGN